MEKSKLTGSGVATEEAKPESPGQEIFVTRDHSAMPLSMSALERARSLLCYVLVGTWVT